jgi:Tyrosine-protein kinase ephrin type A/B receptor-like
MKLKCMQLVSFLVVLCKLRQLHQVVADNNNNKTVSHDCGGPPCRAGCYYKPAMVDNYKIATCNIVPSGYYSPGGEDTLYPCPTGTFASVEGSDICTVCPTGTSASEVGSTTCIACDEGLYAAETGLVECKKCNPNKYFGRGSDGVIRENDIDYCVAPNNAMLGCGNSTTPCTGGCYIVGNVSIKTDFTPRVCSIVPVGFFSPTDDELLYSCPVGTFSLEGSNECTPCAPGSATSVAGSGSCQLCPPSSYASEFASVSCSDCNSSLYAGNGSMSIFRDDQKNASYCLKPIQETSVKMTNIPSEFDSESPSITIPSINPSKYPSTSPSDLFVIPSKQPSTSPSNVIVISLQQPSSLPSNSLVNTNEPTTIFDVITYSTQTPNKVNNSAPSRPNKVVFGDQSSGADDNSRNEKTLKVITLSIFAIPILMVVIMLLLRRRKRHQEMTMMSSPKSQSFVHPDDEATTSSPTFPVPKIISTPRLLHVRSPNDDGDSVVGLFIEDESVM